MLRDGTAAKKLCEFVREGVAIVPQQVVRFRSVKMRIKKKLSLSFGSQKEAETKIS